MCFYADKSDINEETVRLRSHLVKYFELLESEGDPGRELDFRTFALLSAPTGPVPYSQELATSVFDAGESGFREGMNERREHIDDPLDMDETIGEIDSIPKNEVVPTSDFDDKGQAIHRRSAKRGYTAKVWAFLDYDCENGFNFKED